MTLPSISIRMMMNVKVRQKTMPSSLKVTFFKINVQTGQIKAVFIIELPFLSSRSLEFYFFFITLCEFFVRMGHSGQRRAESSKS